jgi:four helix bundle protein
VDLKLRTKTFAIDVLRFCSALPAKPEINVISRQLMRCATSVGANYRSARFARSRKDFIAKLAIVEEEADECMYWLELLQHLATRKHVELERLMDEANQLVSIIVASKKSARTSTPERPVLT